MSTTQTQMIQDPCEECPHRPRLTLLHRVEGILRRYVDGDEWMRLNLWLDNRDLRGEMSRLGSWKNE